MRDDASLIASIRDRDPAALSELYDRYGGRVYGIAVAIVGETMAAQEVAQDTFLKVWNQIAQYRYESVPFSAWLTMVARRTAIDRLRRERRRSDGVESLDADDFPQVADRSQEDEARWRDMQLVMDHLPKEQRDVIMLAFYNGLSQSEIAEHLDTPLGTVKTRFRLGMHKLRAALADLRRS